MSEKKQLNDEELEKVTGGKYIQCAGNLAAYSEYTVRVDKYSGQQGKKYLFKMDDTHWVFGTLSNSYEQRYLLNPWNSYRTHDIKVEDSMGFEEYELSFDTFEKVCIGTEVSDYGTMEVDGDKYIIYDKQ